MRKGYEIIDEVMHFDGKPCKLIFGDQEQIKVLREHEKMLKELNGIGLDIEPEYEIKFRFKCICGLHLSHDEDISDSDDVEDFEPSNKCTCRRCNRQYRFHTGGEFTRYHVSFVGFKNEDDYD
jgi:hypothetical protein